MYICVIINDVSNELSIFFARIISQYMYEENIGQYTYDLQLPLWSSRNLSKFETVPRDIQCEKSRKDGKFGQAGRNNSNISKS